MTASVGVQFQLLNGLAPLAHGLAAPTTFTAKVDDPTCDYLADLTLEVVDGQVRCSAATFTAREGGPAVSTTGLRAVKLKDWVGRATAAVAMRGVPNPKGGGWTFWPAAGRGDVATSDEMSAYVLASTGDRDRDLAEVARVYAEAVEAGQPPTQAVARRFSLSSSTAQRRVREARAAGLDLPAHRGGRPRKEV